MARRGRAAVRSITDIDAQIANLEDRRRELLAKEAERLRLCAERAGVNTSALTDAQLEAAFKDTAGRFHKPAGGPNGTTGKPDRPPAEAPAPRD